MKTSATVVAATILIAGFASNAAVAKPHDSSGWRADQYRQNYDRHIDRNYDSRRKHAQRNTVRLDLPVHIRGSQRIHLRRLINHSYGIDLDHYRLKRVEFNNRGRRHASARLRVGHHVSEPLRLAWGNNFLHAPRHSDGRWVLGVNRARINNIHVVLEPKSQWVDATHRRRF